MASVYKRGRRWWIRYRDAHRQWQSEPCTAVTKTEAKDLATDVERRCERQRRGLEPIPPLVRGSVVGPRDVEEAIAEIDLSLGQPEEARP